MMSRIYLASRYSRREELCGYRGQLRGSGHAVTSRWLDGNLAIKDNGIDLPGTIYESCRLAENDLSDLATASDVIVFTEPPRNGSSRGGRHVELGIAIALHKKIYVIGYRENIFCCLPQIKFFLAWESFVRSQDFTRTPEV